MVKIDTRRAAIQAILARCYVAIAEIDYELREWAKIHGRAS